MKDWLRDTGLPWLLLPPALLAAFVAVPLLWAVLRTRRLFSGS